MNDDLFSSDSTANDLDESFNKTEIDPNKNYLEELVGEGKKFKSPEELARGKAESDAFIRSLLNEIKEVKQELSKRMTVEDLYGRLKNGAQDNVSNDQNNQNDRGNHVEPNSNLNLEEIKKALKEELARDQQEVQRQRNLAEAQEQLKQTFGANASVILNQKASELGVSLEYMKNMAMDSPKAFLALVGNAPKGSKDDFFAPPQNRVNNIGIQNPNNSFGTHKPRSYYEKLKATNPKEYFSPKTSVQMHKDAVALGQAFFDN